MEEEEERKASCDWGGEAEDWEDGEEDQRGAVFWVRDVKPC